MSPAAWLRRLVADARPSMATGDDILQLRAPGLDDFSAWLALRQASRDFLVPWEPSWPSDDLTRRGYARRVQRFEKERVQEIGIAWFLFLRQTGELAGGVNLTNIRLGAAKTGSVGYWMGEKFAGKGLMKRAVRLILPFAFGEVGLERLEAVCIPDNARSIRLLEGLGFRREGMLREFLEINGSRRDHLLYALLKRDHGAENGAAENRGSS